MRVPVFTMRAAISICLVSLMLAPLPAMAALTATDAARLDQFEKSIFGSARTTLSEDTRLRAIETNLFGKAKTGAAKGRLDAIAKIMSGTNKPEYLPPLAAQMDPAGFSKPAPVTTRGGNDDYDRDLTANAGGISDYSPGPAPQRQYQTDADPSARVKQLLRDALQKHSQGDRQGAQRIFKQVLTIDPQNADANFNLGAMAEDAGDLQGAKRYYSAAAAANPSDADVRDALASIDQRVQQQEQARQTAAQVEKKTQLRQVAQDAAAAYKAGKYDQAISLLERIDREAPGDANVKYGLGQAYRGKGDFNRARANLQAAASLDGSNPLYRSTLAELDRQQQQVASNNNSNSGLPAGMRDYGSDASMPQIANDYSQPGYQPQQPAGQITPFSDADNGRLYGHATDSNGRGMSLGGLGGIGSALGGFGIGSMMNRNVAYGGSRGTRLMRGAVTGGLTGAAIGALTSMGRGTGSMKSGAMKGALYGGLFGLLSGF